MNILLFTNSLAGGGAERVVATLANHWAGRGWSVTVLTLAPAHDDFHALVPQVRRIGLDLAAPSSGPIDAVRSNLCRVRALRRVLVTLRPAAAIAMMSTPNVLLALASRGLDLCSVGSERCYPPHFPLGRAWSALRRLGYGRLDAVVAQTQEGADWIRAHSRARQVPVIPNPALWPMPLHAPRLSPAGLSGLGRRVLLAVGRLDGVKDFGVLVRAFARLVPRHPDWDLVILGEGPQRPALEQAAREGSARGRVWLPGIAGNIGEWYIHADLFAMTSRSEGFPNALAEAMAYGLPAVAFDCNTGPRDIVRHGTDGLLVRPGDIDGLDAALDRLMGDAGLRAEFAVRARDARDRFSLERIAGMWESLLRELAADRRASREAVLSPEGEAGS